MNSRTALIEAIQHYQTSYPQEASFKDQFLELLLHPRSFYRDHLPGHITGSAWIIDEQRNFTLLTHHAKLNKWLQPGGHADGDENILHVALREAEEETGLKNFTLLHSSVFDLDIHIIPKRNDFPEHLHFDIRILLGASKDENFIISDESHNLAWVPLKELKARTGNNESITRMAEKVRLL